MLKMLRSAFSRTTNGATDMQVSRAEQYASMLSKQRPTASSQPTSGARAKADQKPATRPASPLVAESIKPIDPTPTAISAPDVSRAIREERSRSARILTAGIASGQVSTACALAFKSDLDADTAIAALSAATIDRNEAARARRSQPYQSIAPNEIATSTTADQIVAAGKKRRGEL
jgi:hypothetical protein